MKEQHKVLLEHSELGIALRGARLGPRSGALDPCLLRLVPVLRAEPTHMAQQGGGHSAKRVDGDCARTSQLSGFFA
jgi:hypothetical protein